MNNRVKAHTRPPTGRGRRNRISEGVSAKDVSRVLRMIRPSFRTEGADIELVGIEDQSVTIRLSGVSEDCPIDFVESSGVIERIVRSRLPQITGLSVV